MAEQKEPKLLFTRVQNEILKEMSLLIRCRHIVVVDETSDVSDKEQAVFCVCWVDENLFSYEKFL